MHYLVYRLATRHAVTYKVTETTTTGNTRAIIVGRIEAESHVAAAAILKARLSRGLKTSPCFFPNPRF